MMQQIELNSGKGNFVFQHVTEHSIRFRIVNRGEDRPFIQWGYCEGMDLPAGSWKIVGIASEIPEEVAAGMLDRMLAGYKNYASDYPICFHDWRASLRSLILSYNLQPETTLILQSL